MAIHSVLNWDDVIDQESIIYTHRNWKPEFISHVFQISINISRGRENHLQ